MSKFLVGQKVKRIEDRSVTGATIKEIEEMPTGFSYLVVYDEGGEGYWPESSLEAA